MRNKKALVVGTVAIALVALALAAFAAFSLFGGGSGDVGRGDAALHDSQQEGAFAESGKAVSDKDAATESGSLSADDIPEGLKGGARAGASGLSVADEGDGGSEDFLGGASGGEGSASSGGSDGAGDAGGSGEGGGSGDAGSGGTEGGGAGNTGEDGGPEWGPLV